MAQEMSRSEIASVIHGEVAKYVDRDFGDGEHFQSDLDLASDDLSAIALALEKRFQVRIERQRYREVFNVAGYAELMAEGLEGKTR
jgi:acyl carrier protein